MPARVGARRGGWRGQGDSGRGLHWVIHGQDQAGAPDRHLVFRQGKLMIQSFVRWAATSAGGGGALAVDGAGSGGVRADGDVGVHGAHVSIVQDEVGVVVMELTFVLVSGNGKRGRGKKAKQRE